MPIHHPHLYPQSTHHSQDFTIHFPCRPNMLQEDSVLLHETNIHRAENYFCHIFKTVHLFSKLF